MKSVDALVLAIVLAPCSCARSQPAEAVVSLPSDGATSATASASSGPSAPSAAAKSPFHVAGAMLVSGLKLANPLRLCAIEGAAFACGGVHVWRAVDGVFVHEPALEKGLMKDEAGDFLKGGVVDMIGSWPDDAWFVAGRGNRETAVLYRFSGGAWKLVGKWKRPSVSDAVSVVHLEKGRVVVHSVHTADGGKQTCRLESFGDGPLLEVPIPVSDAKGLCRHRFARLEASDGGLVLSGMRMSDDKAEHIVWTKGQKPKVVEGDWPAPAPRPTITSTAEWRLEKGRVERRAKDGSTWVAVPVPPPPSFAAKEAKPFVAEALHLRGDEVWIEAKFQNMSDDSPGSLAAGAALLTTTQGKSSTLLE